MASKSKRRRRVLGASCILAALIIAASSFAWFTSKDEVTNRLSANAEYGVSIAEQFQPPENWVPGQEIDKDVAVVNTGNVDAFARVWLTGSMRVLKQQTGTPNSNAQFSIDGTSKAASYDVSATNLYDVTDKNLLSMGLTKQNKTDTGTYLKTLEKSQTANPNASASLDQYGYGNANKDLFSEVQSMQTGILAYAPENAQYCYVLKEETTLPILVKKGADASAVSAATAGVENVDVPAGTLVMVGGIAKASTITGGTFAANTDSVTVKSSSGAPATYNKVVYVAAQTYDTDGNFLPQNIEAESFTPLTDGLYLFQRNEEDAAPNDFEFSGYYVNGTTAASVDAYTNTTYYALNTKVGTPSVAYRSDYTVKGAVDSTSDSYDAPIKVTTNNNNIITGVRPTTNLELYNAKYDTLDDTKLKWVYNGTDKMYAFYDNDGTDGNIFDDTEDIAVEISLSNVGTTNAQEWTAKGIATGADTTYKLNDASTGATVFTGKDGKDVTFYYNDDVESGDTTKILVEKVKLLDQVTNKAYLGFDFDLNVNMESVQVTFDENGNEDARAVAQWASGNAPTGANGSATPSTPSGEITSMSWS